MSPDELRTCPRCGFEGPPGDDCARCGIVFAKYRGPERRLEASPSGSAPGSPAGTSSGGAAAPRFLGLLLLLAAVAGAAYWTERPGNDVEIPIRATAHAATQTARAEVESSGRGTIPVSAGQPAPVPLFPAPSGVGGTGGFTGASTAPEPEPEAKRPRVKYVMGYGWLTQAAGFRRGLQDAADQKRILTLYVYTDWCPYCRKLERGVLADAAVEDCLAYSVKVKVNPERGPAERQIADSFGVTAYPSLFFYDPASGALEKVPNRYDDSTTLASACRATVG